MILKLISISVLLLEGSVECGVAQECSQIPGAWCGDPLFDTCNGEWDYGIDCDPFLDVCCIPDTVATTTEATDLPTNQTTTTASPTAEPEECSEIPGAWCGDPLFDTCNGDWDYGIDCDPFLDVCCIPDTVATTTEATDLPTNQTTTAWPTSKPGECGVGPTFDHYIVGGEEAEPHSWPWMVSYQLDYFGWDDWQHYCGGSLLNNQWVLTAAHCYVKAGEDDFQYFRIILGMHNKNQAAESQIIMPIENIIYHQDYDPEVDGSPFDLALVKLAEPVELVDEISPICLPDFKDQDYMDELCVITGWGLTKGTGDEDVLNQAELPVISNEECDYKWEVGSGRVDLIKENHICVGNGVPGACNGDSGGPLNCYVNGSWQLAGATSFGAAGCEALEAPNVYTRISHFLDWIEDTIAQN